MKNLLESQKEDPHRIGTSGTRRRNFGGTGLSSSDNRILILAIIATIVAAVSAAATTAGLTIAVVLTAAVLLMFRLKSAFWVTLGLIAVMASSSPILGTQSPAISLAMRLAGVCAVILGVMFDRDQHTIGLRLPIHHFVVWACWTNAALLLYIIFATFAHGQSLTFAALAGGTALLVAFEWACFLGVSRLALSQGVIISLFIIVFASLAAGILMPSIALEGGRLRGLTANANSLSFYAFLLGSLGVIFIKRQVLSCIIVALSSVAIIWGASRSNAVALVAVVIIYTFMRRGSNRIAWILVTVPVTVTAVLLGPNLSPILGGLLRTDATRNQSLAYAVETLRVHPFDGIGAGNELVEVASSPLRAAVHAGIWGGLAVLVLWGVLLALGSVWGIAAFALAVGAVLSSMFEGWLLSPFGSFLLVFVATWTLVAREFLSNRGLGCPRPEYELPGVPRSTQPRSR